MLVLGGIGGEYRYIGLLPMLSQSSHTALALALLNRSCLENPIYTFLMFPFDFLEVDSHLLSYRTYNDTGDHCLRYHQYTAGKSPIHPRESCFSEMFVLVLPVHRLACAIFSTPQGNGICMKGIDLVFTYGPPQGIMDCTKSKKRAGGSD